MALKVRNQIRKAVEQENPFIIRCRNCGMALRSELSKKRGFGPTCAIEFADKWIHSHPKYLGERAKKVWSKEEIGALARFL